MTSGNDDGKPELVSSQALPADDPADRLEHLTENRRLIVRRSLLATAVGGVIPLPVLDDYFSGRVKAGMLLKIAERRKVDLAPSSAELLGDPREGTTLRNVTLTAAALLAFKLAWKKFFAVLALGRRADDMASSFQLGMLFDHYCAKMHVGQGIDRAGAIALRAAIFGALADSEKGALTTAFREGGKVLGRSFLEAPTWFSDRVERAARRWAETGGQTADPGDAVEADAGDGTTEQARWLDRAAGAVESRLERVGHNYLLALVRSFERRWQEAEAHRKTTPPPAAGTG